MELDDMDEMYLQVLNNLNNNDLYNMCNGNRNMYDICMQTNNLKQRYLLERRAKLLEVYPEIEEMRRFGPIISPGKKY